MNDDDDYIEKVDGNYYLGSYSLADDILLLDTTISMHDFTTKRYSEIMIYFYTYRMVRTRCIPVIDILQLVICNNVYTVILKTFWIRIIQRIWKRVYALRKKVIKLRKSLPCLTHFSFTGKYLVNATYLPGLYGMLQGI